MTDDEIKAEFEKLVGIPPRLADLEVVKLLGGTREVLVDYVRDHWGVETDDEPIDDVEPPDFEEKYYNF